MTLLLLARRLGRERRSGVEQPDEIHADVRRAGALGFLEEDQMLGRRRAAPAHLFRPVDPGIAGVE